MTSLLSLHDSLVGWVEKIGDQLTPLLARFIFAATLLVYFWQSAVLKLGEGFFGIFKVTSGGFGQIFPKQAEAVLWDVTQMTAFQKLVVLAGTWAEIILPLLIVVGLLTRLAAVGMIGFVVMQSLTDLFGHGGLAHVETFGRWFDKAPDSAILDQRLFWCFLLLALVIKGAGVLSLDTLLRKKLTANTTMA